jgi:hypothetical protein
MSKFVIITGTFEEIESKLNVLYQEHGKKLNPFLGLDCGLLCFIDGDA